MKKFCVFAAVLAALFLVVGCSDSSGGSSGTTYTAPKVASPGDLPASGATSYPTTKTEALEVYSNALSALSDAANPMSSLSAGKIDPKARATEVFDEPINFTQAVGGGMVSYTGSVKGSVTTPDITELEPNKTYKTRAIQTIVLDGEITDCTVSDGDEYLINGETKDRLYMNMATSMYTNAEAHIDSMDISVQASMASGAALSIRNTTTGIGGKFIISYALTIDTDDLSDDIDEEQAQIFRDKKAMLRVYNDANVLVFEGEVSLSELGPSIADEI